MPNVQNYGDASGPLGNIEIPPEVKQLASAEHSLKRIEQEQKDGVYISAMDKDWQNIVGFLSQVSELSPAKGAEAILKTIAKSDKSKVAGYDELWSMFRANVDRIHATATKDEKIVETAQMAGIEDASAIKLLEEAVLERYSTANEGNGRKPSGTAIPYTPQSGKPDESASANYSSTPTNVQINFSYTVPEEWKNSNMRAYLSQVDGMDLSTAVSSLATILSHPEVREGQWKDTLWNAFNDDLYKLTHGDALSKEIDFEGANKAVGELWKAINDSEQRLQEEHTVQDSPERARQKEQIAADEGIKQQLAELASNFNLANPQTYVPKPDNSKSGAIGSRVATSGKSL